MLPLLRSFVLIVFAVGTAVAQADFSAEIVDLRQPGNPALAKICFAKDKRRIDFLPASGTRSILIPSGSATDPKRAEMQVDGRGNTFLLDLAKHTSTVLWHARSQYWQSTTTQLRLSELYGLYSFIHPANAENACVEWMKAPGAGNETCRKLGVDFINGRVAIKYDFSCYEEICHLWIDRKLHFLIKRESKWTSTELRNIHELPQASALFEVPASYKRLERYGGVIGPHEPQ